ncbi:UDP-phosphate glycosyltransferase [Microbacterium esteraromaticum]|nr:UDP-phosphate glycosyltransferase [Microbacterium esteraromaticum]
MGVATLIGMLAGALLIPVESPLWLVVGPAAAMSVLGFVDDVRSLSARVRFALQFVIGVLVGVGVATLFDLNWWTVPIVAVLFSAFVNMANFMDGANGVSSLFGTVSGSAFAIVGIFTDRGWLFATGVLIAVAFLVFLPWNFLGAGMFLGDCGSYLLGASVGATSIAAIASGVAWPAALAPMAIYATDTATTIATRLVRRERWWEAHRQHQYQQLIDSGWSHIRAALWLAMFVALAAAGGMVALLDRPGATLIAASAVAAVCVAYVLSGRLVVNTRRRIPA